VNIVSVGVDISHVMDDLRWLAVGDTRLYWWSEQKRIVVGASGGRMDVPTVRFVFRPAFPALNFE
jgi:hypothetical protein